MSQPEPPAPEDRARSQMDRLRDQARILGESRMILGDDAAAVTDEQQVQVTEAVRAYCLRVGRKHAQVARAIGVSAAVVSQVLSRTYKGDWQAVVIALDRWLEEESKRDAAPKPTEFVWTKVAEEILTVAEICSAQGCIGLVYDRYGSGIGKTIALQAIAADKPGAVYLSVQTAAATPLGVLRQVGKAVRAEVSNTHQASVRVWMDAVCRVLAGSGRLLLVDEIHKLCGLKDDKALHVLRDLHDATGCPQLWCGTTDLVAYLGQGKARGREPLAQIRSRIGISRDLRERVGEGPDGGGGQPLFSIEEVRKVFARSKLRLAPDAVRYLSLLSGLPDSGALRTCKYLVVMATRINEARGATALTADHLRSAHRLLVSRSSADLVEARMEQSAGRPAAVKVG